MQVKNIVIIGAGPAGLTAAYEFLRQGREYHITILEETDAIGGISRTVRYQGNRMDIGGHRFFSKDEKVMKWWEDRMPLQGSPAHDDKVLGRRAVLKKGGPDPEKEDRVMLVRRRVSRIYYQGKFFDYPISMKWDTMRQMGILCTVRAAFSYFAACVRKREESSLENFYTNRFGKALYSMFFESYTEKLWGRHPRAISADWGSQRVKGLSVTAILKDMWEKIFPGNRKRQVETSLIEEFWYPKYGPGQLWEQVAGEIREMGGEICFGSRVTGFERNPDGSIGRVLYEKEGKTETKEADIVFSSMPLKDLVTCMADVPRDIREIAQGLPYRDFVTVGLLVHSLNLKNKTKIPTINNAVPDCWIYVQDGGVKLGRIQIFNNWSPYMVKDPKDSMFIGLEYFCQEGDEFWNLGEEACAEYARNELTSMGILSDGAEIMGFHRERVKKAYPAYFDTYERIGDVIEYLDENCGNLYCIGRNGQHRYNNMDHSMATAFEAVKNVLEGRRDKENVWNVNTEKEYHEER